MKTLKERLLLNKSGVVLMSVMIILLVMTIIISGVVFITVANLENSQKTASHTETFYVAEGGVNYLAQTFEAYYTNVPKASPTAFFTLMDNFIATYPVGNKQVVSFSSNKGKTSQALVWIESIPDSDPSSQKYAIKSEGYIGNVKRTLSKIVEISYVNGGLAFNDAVLAVGSLIIGGAYIEGTIQTTSTLPSAIVFNGGTVDGIYIPTGTTPTTIVTSSNYNNSIPGLGTSGIYLQDPPTIKKIDILTAPVTTTHLDEFSSISGASTYQIVDTQGNFSITSNSNLSVPTVYNLGDDNLGQSLFYVPNFKVTALAPNFTLEINRDITIVTDTLWLNNQLKVTGSGKLTIYVKPSASLNSTNSSLQINAGGIVGHQVDSTKMSIYVGALTFKDGSQDKPVLLSLGSGTYYFSLICDNLNIDLGSSVLRGALATNAEEANAVKINNLGPANIFIGPSSASSAILLYAPSAKVIMKSSSSSFYGAIVAGSFVSSTGNSHPTIVYSSAVNTYIPIDVIDLSGITTPPAIKIVKSPTLE